MLFRTVWCRLRRVHIQALFTHQRAFQRAQRVVSVVASIKMSFLLPCQCVRIVLLIIEPTLSRGAWLQ